MKVLTPEIAIQAIASHLSEQHGHDDGVIFIGLDEVNYLLDSDYTGEEEKRAFMKETLVALGSAMLLPDKFVFVVIAATTILPINIVFQQSGLLFEPLPIRLLCGDQCEAIVQEMAASISSAHWAEWRTCRAFRTVLADFASMPRKAEQLLSYVNSQLSAGTALVDIDYQFICHKLISSFEPSAMVGKLAERLVTNIILATHVKRHQVVDDTKSPFTYGELESLGALTLETSIDTLLTVQMPYSQFRALVQLMDGGDLLTKSLRKICNLVQREEEYGMLSWQTFEVLHCNVEACREMLFARMREERPYTSIGEFYGLTNGSIDFDFIVRRNCQVVTSVGRYPTKAWGILADDPTKLDSAGNKLDATTSYIKNAAGAAFYSFTLRQLEEVGGGTMLFCGQQKLYVESAVSAGMIRDEANKVVDSLPEGIPFVLIVVAPKVTSDALTDLPENCLVVTGLALEKFYSVFSARANLLSKESLSRINVNTASRSELMTLDHIGINVADAIIRSRKQKGFFVSWEDLNTRIARTRKCKEASFSY